MTDAWGRGVQSISAWVTGHADQFKVLSQKRDVDGPMQDRALEIVREFIIERGLILFGGLAIDYALRLRGSRIYPDDERPDFDVYSPHSVEDAYDLAEKLHAAGFENVGAIRAIHVQTMRVKTDFIFVADIGYMPESVFSTVPFVLFGGMKVLHPDYQRMDLHLAFCFPFSGAPREDVFHRWGKDMRRFNIVNKFYPVEEGKLQEAQKTGGSLSPAAAVNRVKLPAKWLNSPLEYPAAVHGFAAYGLLREALDLMIGTLDLDLKINISAPPLRVQLNPAGSELIFESPAEWNHLVVAATSPRAFIADAERGGRTAWYDPFMDARPEMAVIESGREFSPLHVYSYEDKLLSVAAVEVSVVGGGEKRVPLFMVSPQALLLYFLFEAHRATGDARRIATQYYLWTLEVLRASAQILSKVTINAGTDSDVAAKVVRKFINTSPFFLTTRTIGAVNHDPSYLINMARAVKDVGDIPPPSLHLSPSLGKILDGLPTDYFPGNPRRKRPIPRGATFRYEDHVLFRRSGARSTTSA